MNSNNLTSILLNYASSLDLSMQYRVVVLATQGNFSISSVTPGSFTPDILSSDISTLKPTLESFSAWNGQFECYLALSQCGVDFWITSLSPQ